jgi:hypothetical protein
MEKSIRSICVVCFRKLSLSSRKNCNYAENFEMVVDHPGSVRMLQILSEMLFGPKTVTGDRMIHGYVLLHVNGFDAWYLTYARRSCSLPLARE